MWKLKQLQVIQGKANEIWLNVNFRKGLLTAITDPNSLWQELEVDIDTNLVDDHFHKCWNGLLYCVASGGQSHELYSKVSTQIIDVMLNAGLVTKKRNLISITNQGFQFLLADSSEQIATLLIQMCLDSPPEFLIEAVHLVMNIALLVPGQFYPLTKLTTTQKVMIKSLAEYGLVMLTKSRNVAGFVPTKLAKAVSYTGEMPLMLTKEEGFLIIETNYKFYAYTDSPLHRSILSLFMRIKTQFPNMIFGYLSQDSIQNALQKGISAAQIIKFLNSSAHAVMRTNLPILPPTIVDQVNLWEQDRNRLRAKAGYMYQQFLSAADFEKTLAEGNRLNAVLYANPATRIIIVSDVGHPQIKNFVKNNL